MSGLIKASLISAQTRGNSHSAQVIFTRFMPPETRITYRFSWQDSHVIANTPLAWMLALPQRNEAEPINYTHSTVWLLLTRGF